MELKYHPQPGYLAWSNSKNHSELLASASLNQVNGLYSLDILEVDLQQRSKKIKVVGSAYTDTPFRCIAWDNYGQKQGAFPNGLIFTGMDDGSYRLWNPSDIISTYEARQDGPPDNILQIQTCLVYQQEPQQGGFPTMCCEWNSLRNNFLAFGGTDVLLLNVGKNPGDPELIKPGKKNPHTNSYVTSVSWNREVPHILASASQNGLVALWDIKTNNSIFQFKDSISSSGNRNVVICWSKSISTQIAVTLDDQKRNELQIWDLRNQKGPVIVIDKLHTKGINAMDWSQTDPELILTGSRDNHLACWNYTQEQTPLSENVIDGGVFTVKWSKKLPSIYATSNQQKLSVYSLSDNLYGYVPKWFKVPTSATMIGCDSVMTYSQQRGPVLIQSKVPNTKQDQSLKNELKSLNNALQGVFDQRQNDSQLSILIKAKMSNDGDNSIYDYLGFNKEKIVKQVQTYTCKKRQFSIGAKSQKQKVVKPKAKAYTQIQGSDALKFFSQIGNKHLEVKQQDQDNNQGQVQYDMVPRNFNWNIGKQRLVKQNLLIGNYESAIDAALKCGRTAQALIIAYSVDQNLFTTTLKTFFTQTTDNFITDVLKCIAYKDPQQLIDKYDLQKWKQCIALIYSMSSRDKRSKLLKLLAQRLINQTQEGNQQNSQQIISQTYAPIICSILAQDFQYIAKLYANNLKHFRSGSNQRKRIVIQYTRRLVSIYQGITVDLGQCKQYNQMLRQSMFIAIQMKEKSIAYSLCNRLPNNQRMLDFLVCSSKELDKYKTNVQIKTNVLPVMQPKKVEKKGKYQHQHHQPQQGVPKPKKNIFPPKQEERNVPQPPGPPKRRDREEDSVGFSPFQNAPKQPIEKSAPPPKKNLNNPPPPPVTSKKVIHHQKHQEEDWESQPEREVHKPPPQMTPQKKSNPPPPPPRHATTHDQSMEEESRAVQRPPPPPRGPPPVTQKKVSQPQPPPGKYSPPQPALSKYESEESETQQRRQVVPPPSKKKNPPPPAPSNRNIPEPDRIPVKEEPVQHVPPPKRMPQQPPPRQQQVKRQPPSYPQKKEQKQEHQQSYEQAPQPPVKRNVPVPPPVKRPPPGPPRR